VVFLWPFVAGFVGYFATGVDDTVALAGILDSKVSKYLVSLGIFIATFFIILLAYFLSLGFYFLPQWSGGAGLIFLGVWVAFHHQKHFYRHHKRHQPKIQTFLEESRYVWAGFFVKMLTGVDDILAYAFILLIPGAFYGITLGVLFATALEIYIVISISKRFLQIKNKEIYAGASLVVLGILSLIHFFG